MVALRLSLAAFGLADATGAAPGRPAVLQVGQQQGDANHVLAELAAAARVTAVPAPAALP